MLVLSRKRDEQIVIGADVVITVCEIRGDRVRLGIEAPKHISVHRREVFDRIARGEDVRAGTAPGILGNVANKTVEDRYKEQDPPA